MARNKTPLEVRFWTKVRKCDGCWEWRGSILPDGYGSFWRDKRFGCVRAHRMSWVLANGEISQDQWVLHHCDNPICVKPAHLFLGDVSDNVADSIAKDRHVRGERFRDAKLTAQQVVEIRNRHSTGEQPIELAKDYPVSRFTIAKICRGETWRHLT